MNFGSLESQINYSLIIGPWGEKKGIQSSAPLPSLFPGGINYVDEAMKLIAMCANKMDYKPETFAEIIGIPNGISNGYIY